MNIFDNQNEWLVTGGAGFIGSNLIDDLIKKGQKVTCVDDFSSGSIKNLKKNHLLKIINNKVQDTNLIDLGENFKGVFHLAAQASAPKSVKYMFDSSSNNLLSSFKIWEYCREKKIPVVYASSSAVYGDLPFGDDQLNEHNLLSPYSMDKLSIENYAKVFWHLYKIPSIGLRFFNVYGPRQNPSNPYSGVISIFLDRLLSGKDIIVNGGFQTRDFIYVKDVTKVLIHSMNKSNNEKNCDVFNVGTGHSITIDNLVSILSDLLKLKPKIIKNELLEGDPRQSNCITTKLRRNMGIKVEDFLPLNKGLELSLEYIKRIV